MEITKQQIGDVLEVRIKGRLDAYWADHLSSALEEALRGGADRIRLHMADVSYMSSVGMRVLLKFYKQLQRIKGSFAVTNPSEAVKTVLELAGLHALLTIETAAEAAALAARRVPARRLTLGGAAFEIFDLGRDASLTCRLVGQPELLTGCRFRPQHCRILQFPATTFGVGLGAFGESFADCEGRFGEFLAAAGAAAYLPTDGTNVPDYLVAAGAYVPQVNVLYALSCEGRFAQLARFEASEANDRGTLTLAALAGACLDIADTDTAGIIMVAESAGLVGAALRRSPALEGCDSAPFTHPQIREWLSFTPERAYPRSLAVVVGGAARAERPEVASLLRPLGDGPWPAGHFHAAAFSYRPLQKGEVDLQPTVATLFEAETLQGVLHLLTDDRAIAGAGQSEFVRGACWIGPIGAIVTERG